jgi:gamma-glutamyl-gamma-aminobutyrate hydrolase PuuD
MKTKIFPRSFVMLFILLAITMLFAPRTYAKTSKDVIQIKTLVLTDRTNKRMQPEIFHALTDGANRLNKTDKDKIKFKFTVFNPYLASPTANKPFAKQQRRIMNLLNKSVSTVQTIDEEMPINQDLFTNILAYIKKNPYSNLAALQEEINTIIPRYNFIIIESTGATVIHPIFYNKKVNNVEVGYATTDDIKDTLYGLFVLDAALKNKKPVLGFCHGAQLAYLHAGGTLGRHVPYTVEQPNIVKGATYARNNPHGGEVESWQIDAMLNSRDLNDRTVYSENKYPLPKQIHAVVHKGETMKKYLSKDFNHTLAMEGPAPKLIEVFSYHPLSQNSSAAQRQYELTPKEVAKYNEEYPRLDAASIKKFKKTMHQRKIVDAFLYKSILGFQYHPQYTYGTLDTSDVFQYIIKSLLKQEINKEKQLKN